MFTVLLFKVHIQTHIGWSIYIKCKHLEWNTSSLLQVGCDGKGQHRDDENILYVTLVLAALADTIFWNRQGTQFKWMQFVVCAVFLARLIKQLLPTGLWEVQSWSVGGSDRKNQNFGDVLMVFLLSEKSYKRKRNSGETGGLQAELGRDAVLLTVMLSAWDLKPLVSESPINQKPIGGES